MAENTDLTVLLDRILTTKNELRDIIDTEEIDFTQLPSMIYNWLVDQYNSAWVDGYNQAWYEIFNSHVSKTGPLTHIEFTPPEIPDYPDYDYDILTQIMNECLLSRRDIRDVLHLTGDDKDLFETYPDYLRAEFARMSTNGYDDGYAQAYADAPGYGILPPNIQCNNNIVTITARTEGQEVWYKVGEYGVFAPYEGPFEIDRDTTVFAYSKDGNGESIVISKTFYFSVVLAPTIDQSMNVVSIIAADHTDRLFYTTDGRDPAHYGVEYTSPIHITSTTIIKAVAFNGQIYSNLTTKLCTYYKNADKPFTVTALEAGTFLIYLGWPDDDIDSGEEVNNTTKWFDIKTSNSYIDVSYKIVYWGGVKRYGDYGNLTFEWDKPAKTIVIDNVEAGDTFEIRMISRYKRNTYQDDIDKKENFNLTPCVFISTFNYNISGNIASLCYRPDTVLNDYIAPPSEYWFAENWNGLDGYVHYFDACNPIVFNVWPRQSYHKRLSQSIGPLCFADLTVTKTALENISAINQNKYNGYSGTRGVVDASNLVIPDYPTPNGFYAQSFRACRHLVYGPQILLRHLSQAVFKNTFAYCTSLQRLEMVDNEGHLELSALESTFYGCTSLLNTPIQNITIDEWSCRALYYTFFGCISLLSTPNIKFVNPQNKVVPTACFWGTFAYCKQLITAPTINNALFSNLSMVYTFAYCDKLVNVQPTIRGGFIDGILPYQMTAGIITNSESNRLSEKLPSFNNSLGGPKGFFDPLDGVSTYKDGNATKSGSSFSWYKPGEMITVVSPGPPNTIFNSTEVDIRTRGYQQFRSTFEGCTSLAIIPQIFITPAEDSFNSTFKNCISLRHCPDFGFTDLEAKGCLHSMFEGCYTLVTAPSVIGNPDSKIGSEACYAMFKNCKSLVTPPSLPITYFYHSAEVAPGSIPSQDQSSYRIYKEMFMGCTSLTTSPDLLAEDIVTTATTIGNYESMFEGCSSLTQVRCHLLGTTSAGDRFMIGTPSSGIFYAKAGSRLNIPSGWTVIYEN